MGKIQLVDGEVQRPAKTPPPGTEVVVAADISSTKWVYGVRWQGEERYRLSTPAGLKHLEALIGRFEGCPVRFAYEACGFGFEAAWLLAERGVEVTVIAPSRMERAPGLQVKTDRNDVGKMARKLEQRDLKGMTYQGAAHALDVVDAATQIRARNPIPVDADQQSLLDHGCFLMLRSLAKVW